MRPMVKLRLSTFFQNKEHDDDDDDDDDDDLSLHCATVHQKVICMFLGVF